MFLFISLSLLLLSFQLAFPRLRKEWWDGEIPLSHSPSNLPFPWFVCGSLHYTPEHCLANGGLPLFRCGKPRFKWLQNVSWKEPCVKPGGKNPWLPTLVATGRVGTMIRFRWVASFWGRFLPLKTPSPGEVNLLQTYSPCYPKS